MQAPPPETSGALEAGEGIAQIARDPLQNLRFFRATAC
jgi:hypothetical protein